MFFRVKDAYSNAQAYYFLAWFKSISGLSSESSVLRFSWGDIPGFEAVVKSI